MTLDSVFKKYIKEISKEVDDKTPLYMENGHFVYNIYGEVDKELINDIIDDVADVITDVLYDRTSILYDEEVVSNFLKKKNIIKFIKN